MPDAFSHGNQTSSYIDGDVVTRAQQTLGFTDMVSMKTSSDIRASLRIKHTSKQKQINLALQINYIVGDVRKKQKCLFVCLC